MMVIEKKKIRIMKLIDTSDIFEGVNNTLEEVAVIPC